MRAFVAFANGCGGCATEISRVLKHKPPRGVPVGDSFFRGALRAATFFEGPTMKKTFISAAAVLAFAATAHADELSDIQSQAKQLREQNAAMTRRLADIEKRQKALEAQKPVAATINPVD